MADDGVKISALTEVLTEPATGEMVASVVGGVTYKRDIGKRLPSTMQKSALAGYGGTPSGTNPYATQTGATALAATAARPLSDLSRVMRINGDGVPTFPDNVAGTYQSYKGFTNQAFTYATGCTPVYENGYIKVTINTAGNWFLGLPEISQFNSALYIVSYRAPANRHFTIVGQGTTFTFVADQATNGQNQVVSGFSTVPNKKLEVNNGDWQVGDVVYIYATYIGSGLYDTPVYDKACCNRFTNNGVVPVPGTRGMAMSFNGNSYLQLDNPVIGTSGTIAFKFKRKLINSLKIIIDNMKDFKGISIKFNADNTISVFYGNGTETPSIKTSSSYSDTTIFHSCIIKLDYANNLLSIYIDGVFVVSGSYNNAVASSTSLYIGTSFYGGSVDAELADIRYDTAIWTQNDVTRYHNGDDAVDSQQKAITNVPNAIKICDSKGNIRQPGLPVYADNTAALAGGLVAGEPYRTSTGVLMVVY